MNSTRNDSFICVFFCTLLQKGEVDLSIVLGLDFSHTGQEGSFERREFEQKLREDLAFASGWEGSLGSGHGRPTAIVSERLVDVHRSSEGLGIY